ncbi:MAG: hypothetical protein II615_06520, partial [Ruminococcus sp.]|nr:hypothetical protein [Ruminococcus sp.]
KADAQCGRLRERDDPVHGHRLTTKNGSLQAFHVVLVRGRELSEVPSNYHAKKAPCLNRELFENQQ